MMRRQDKRRKRQSPCVLTRYLLVCDSLFSFRGRTREEERKIVTEERTKVSI